MTAVLLAVLAFVLMEPITAGIHRLVMHRFGMGWHRSHHDPPRHAFEANDLFPVVFATATIGLLCLGVFAEVAPGVLIPVGIGITAYGAGYLLVHDIVIHRRLPFVRVPDALLRRWRVAHNVHHLYSRAPYGFLAPVVPAALRERAAASRVERTRRGISSISDSRR
jgi:beta-carotene 3-hydroxylase